MSTKTDQMQFPELVDIPMVAKWLGVGVRHVRRLVTEQRIPYIEWGHLIRFDIGQVGDWLKDAERPPR
jgi:excisionase family DNA binding protein